MLLCKFEFLTVLNIIIYVLFRFMSIAVGCYYLILEEHENDMQYMVWKINEETVDYY